MTLKRNDRSNHSFQSVTPDDIKDRHATRIIIHIYKHHKRQKYHEYFDFQSRGTQVTESQKKKDATLENLDQRYIAGYVINYHHRETDARGYIGNAKPVLNQLWKNLTYPRM